MQINNEIKASLKVDKPDLYIEVLETENRELKQYYAKAKEQLKDVVLERNRYYAQVQLLNKEIEELKGLSDISVRDVVSEEKLKSLVNTLKSIEDNVKFEINKLSDLTDILG